MQISLHCMEIIVATMQSGLWVLGSPLLEVCVHLFSANLDVVL